MGARQKVWREGMQGGIKGHYDWIEAASEISDTDDLKTIDVPVLVVHGDGDQIVRIVAARTALDEDAAPYRSRGYEGAPHGLPVTMQDRLNADFLAFIAG